MNNVTLHLHKFRKKKVHERRPLRETSEYKCGNDKTREHCSTRNFLTHILHETSLGIIIESRIRVYGRPRVQMSVPRLW